MECSSCFTNDILAEAPLALHPQTHLPFFASMAGVETALRDSLAVLQEVLEGLVAGRDGLWTARNLLRRNPQLLATNLARVLSLQDQLDDIDDTIREVQQAVVAQLHALVPFNTDVTPSGSSRVFRDATPGDSGRYIEVRRTRSRSRTWRRSCAAPRSSGGLPSSNNRPTATARRARSTPRSRSS